MINKKIYNPSWLVKKTYLWGRSAIMLKKDDVFLAFYPKTGSTWVRIFLYNMLLKNETFTFDDLNSVMPEFGHPSFFDKWKFNGVPKLIKTHSPFRSLFTKNRVILFGREPRDTMISFLHYANAKKEIDFSGNLHDLVFHPEIGMESYMKFYTSWNEKATLFIKYEELKRNPFETFKKLLSTLDIVCTEEEIKAALAKSSLEKTREAQEQSSEEFQKTFKDGFLFARKGQSGNGKSYFDDELNAYYKELREKYNFNLYDF
jgi:hypothetical protein